MPDLSTTAKKKAEKSRSPRDCPGELHGCLGAQNGGAFYAGGSYHGRERRFFGNQLFQIKQKLCNNMD